MYDGIASAGERAGKRGGARGLDGVAGVRRRPQDGDCALKGAEEKGNTRGTERSIWLARGRDAVAFVGERAEAFPISSHQACTHFIL